MSKFSKRWVTLLLAFLTMFPLSTAQVPSHEVRKAFFRSRIFQEAPAEGITLLSTERSFDAFLLNGTTDDIVLQYAFKPATGVSPNQYSTSFVCNSGTVWDAQSCSVTNAEASVVGSQEAVLNSTVRCAFSSFPGSTQCAMVATLQTTARQINSYDLEVDAVARQTERYRSETINVNVYGVIFYIPDANGELSEEAAIVSGDSLAYRLPNFDRTQQEVREISTFAFIPGTQSVGTQGLELYSSATTTLDFEDFIFRYDASCQLAGGVFENGGVTLSTPDSCGVGFAIEDETTYPTLGVHIRPYKSGKVTMRFFWPIFGTSSDSYEQIVTFQVEEPAPPVIVAVEKLDFYKSVPCDVEILKVIGFNMRFADTRQLVVFSLDEESSLVWSETIDGFRYDEGTDTSQVTFENGGGSGQGVSFGVRAIFGDQVRNAVTLAEIDLTLVFTTPIVLTALNETVVGVGGGEVLEVSGALEEFGVQDYVYIGSFQIPAGDLISFDSERLILFSPPLVDLGSSFSYPITVGVCAERSNALTLQYQVAPVLRISSSDTSRDNVEVYVVKVNEETTFIAEVTGNNLGASFEWKLFNAAGEEVDIGDATANSQVFIVRPALLATSNERYTLQVTVTNSLGLSVTESMQIMRAETQQEYVLVNVHEIGSTIQRSVGAATLVNAHVTTETSLDPTVVLEWTYRDKAYLVDQQVFESEDGAVTTQATGPTRFGLEFFILREDLVLGSQDISLTATLAADPSVRGSDSIALVVVASPLRAVINEGINGTLLLTGADFELSGSGSSDTDLLSGEGDPSTGLTYEWLSCRKSLRSSFATEVTDCSEIFPIDKTAVNITALSNDLLSSRLDTGSSPQSTYLSFGLRIRKDTRVSEAYLYVELRTIDVPQKVPTLSSLEIVDRKGNILPRTGISKFGDIIIQPASEDAVVTWAYDMSLRNQRFLFTQFGALRNGTGFISARGVNSRLPIGFTPGVLDANTDYKVEITVSASDTPLTSSFELSFRTEEVPRLTCTPPEQTSGTVQETRFTASATLSFESQDIEYCFFLTTETENFILGDGCSTVPFATFTFYRAGTYSLSCMAKTSSGHVADIVTLPNAVILTNPVIEGDAITMLTARLTVLESEVKRCEALHDDACLISLISVAKDFAYEVSTATANNPGSQSDALIDATQSYITRLATLSSSLAKNTVFRPNQISTAVDLSYNLLLVPSNFITDEATLLATLSQAEAAITSTSSQSLVPIPSEELITRMATIANRSIGTAYRLSAGGTTRTVSLTPGVLTEVLLKLPRLLATTRTQQAECGYKGALNTRGGGVALPEISVGVNVVCSGERGMAEAGKVFASVCVQGRDSVSVAEIPGLLVQASGLVEGLVEVGALVDSGGNGCVDVRIVSAVAESEGADTVAGKVGDCDGCLERVETVIEGGVVSMRSESTGLFIVGRKLGSITGVTMIGWIVLGVIAGILVIVAGAVLWLGNMVEEGGEESIIDWEYIERDLFGRDHPRKPTNPPVL